MCPHACMCVRMLGLFSGSVRKEELMDASNLFIFSQVHFTVYIYLHPTCNDEHTPNAVLHPSTHPPIHPSTHTLTLPLLPLPLSTSTPLSLSAPPNPPTPLRR